MVQCTYSSSIRSASLALGSQHQKTLLSKLKKNYSVVFSIHGMLMHVHVSSKELVYNIVINDFLFFINLLANVKVGYNLTAKKVILNSKC